MDYEVVLAQVWILFVYDHHYICYWCFSWAINIDYGALLTHYACRISGFIAQSLFLSFFTWSTQFDHGQQVVPSGFGYDGSLLCFWHLLVCTTMSLASVRHYMLHVMVIFIIIIICSWQVIIKYNTIKMMQLESHYKIQYNKKNGNKFFLSGYLACCK